MEISEPEPVERDIFSSFKETLHIISESTDANSIWRVAANDLKVIYPTLEDFENSLEDIKKMIPLSFTKDKQRLFQSESLQAFLILQKEDDPSYNVEWTEGVYQLKKEELVHRVADIGCKLRLYGYQSATIEDCRKFIETSDWLSLIGSNYQNEAVRAIKQAMLDTKIWKDVLERNIRKALSPPETQASIDEIFGPDSDSDSEEESGADDASDADADDADADDDGDADGNSKDGSFVSESVFSSLSGHSRTKKSKSGSKKRSKREIHFDDLTVEGYFVDPRRRFKFYWIHAIFGFFKFGICSVGEQEFLKRYCPAYGNFDYNLRIIQHWGKEDFDRAHWDKEKLLFKLFSKNRIFGSKRELFWVFDEEGRDLSSLYIETIEMLAGFTLQQSVNFVSKIRSEGVDEWIERRLTELKVVPQSVPEELATLGVTPAQVAKLFRSAAVKKMSRYLIPQRISSEEGAEKESDDESIDCASERIGSRSKCKRIRRDSDVDSSEEEDDVDTDKVAERMADEDISRMRSLLDSCLDGFSLDVDDPSILVSTADGDILQVAVTGQEGADFSRSSDGVGSGSADIVGQCGAGESSSSSDSSSSDSSRTVLRLLQERFQAQYSKTVQLFLKSFGEWISPESLQTLSFSSEDDSMKGGLVGFLTPVPWDTDGAFTIVLNNERTEPQQTQVELKYRPEQASTGEGYFSHEVQELELDGDKDPSPNRRNLSKWILFSEEHSDINIPKSAFDDYSRTLQDRCNRYYDELRQQKKAEYMESLEKTAGAQSKAVGGAPRSGRRKAGGTQSKALGAAPRSGSAKAGGAQSSSRRNGDSRSATGQMNKKGGDERQVKRTKTSGWTVDSLKTFLSGIVASITIVEGIQSEHMVQSIFDKYIHRHKNLGKKDRVEKTAGFTCSRGPYKYYVTVVKAIPFDDRRGQARDTFVFGVSVEHKSIRKRLYADITINADPASSAYKWNSFYFYKTDEHDQADIEQIQTHALNLLLIIPAYMYKFETQKALRRSMYIEYDLGIDNRTRPHVKAVREIIKQNVGTLFNSSSGQYHLNFHF